MFSCLFVVVFCISFQLLKAIFVLALRCVLIHRWSWAVGMLVQHIRLTGYGHVRLADVYWSIMKGRTLGTGNRLVSVECCVY